MRKITVLVLMLVFVTAPLLADTSKISPDLLPYLNTNQKVQVIVQYAPGTQVTCSGLLSLVGCLVNDVLKLGGSILSQLPLVNAVVALLDGTGIVNLSNDPDVTYISKDRSLSPTLSNAAPPIKSQIAWQSKKTGSGVAVALIDSGVNSHKDFNDAYGGSRVVFSQNFVPGAASASDQYGHGTHIAGLIAGNGASS